MRTGSPVLLLSADAAAGAAGPAWFDAVIRAAAAEFPDARIEGTLDCGAMPGPALAALRHGLKRIRYDGPSFDAIADIAGQYGATVLRERPPALDLAVEPDANGPQSMAALIERCSGWLQAGA